MKPHSEKNLPEDAPVRVNKLLAERGICSRREADGFIDRGFVVIDGRYIAKVGEKVMRSQRLTLDPRALGELDSQITLVLNKPLGFVSGQAEEGRIPAVTLITEESHYEKDRSGIAYSPAHAFGLAPAGRLDIDSTGLLVLTRNGVLARQLIGQDSPIDKEYLVRIKGDVGKRTIALLCHGLSLDNRPLRPAEVSHDKENLLRFILREGRKRQIRRMCELVGLEVVSLKRIRIGKVRLGNLPYGKWRYIGREEEF